jgi:dTMP kinase
VVSDRSVYSTLAYQGYGRQLPLDDVRRINEWALQGTWPSLVVLLEVPDEVIAARMSARELDRFEQEGDAFHARVREGFREMAGGDPDRWVVVSAEGPTADVAAAIRDAVRDRAGV